MIEFRRSINLHFRGCLNINTLTGKGIVAAAKEAPKDNLAQAIKAKKSKGKSK